MCNKCEPSSITIPMDQYVELRRDAAKLAALETGGVDNWQWYDQSIRINYKDPHPDYLYTWE